MSVRKNKKWTTEEIKDVIDMRDKGMSFNELGKKYNKHPTTMGNLYKYYTRKKVKNPTIKKFKGFNGTRVQWRNPTRIDGFDKKRRQQHPIYLLWRDIMRRCYDENSGGYYNYGARGIRVSPRWQDYDNFYDDVNPRPEGTSLDRVNTYGDYSEDNWRWATIKEQNRNKRNNAYVKMENKIVTLAEAREKTGISESLIRYREKLKGKWNFPVREKNTELDIEKIIEMKKQGMGYRKIAKELGVSATTIKNRLIESGNYVYQEPIRYEVDEEKLIEMRRSGMKIREIAEETGISINVVYKTIRHIRKKDITKEIINLKKKGLSVKQISKEAGISVGAVYYRIRTQT